MAIMESLIATGLTNAANAGLAGTAAKGTVDMLNNKDKTGSKVVGDELTDSLASAKEEKPTKKPIDWNDDLRLELSEAGVSTYDLNRLEKGIPLSNYQMSKLSPMLREKLGDDIDLAYGDDEIINSNLPSYWAQQSINGGLMPPDWNDDDDDPDEDVKFKRLKEKWRKHFKNYAESDPERKQKLVKATKDVFKQRNNEALDEIMKEIANVSKGEESNPYAFNKLMEGKTSSKLSATLRKVMGVKATDELLNKGFTAEQVERINELVEKMEPYIKELENFGFSSKR